MLRPFAGYERLARLQGDEAPTVTAGATRLLLAIGGTVALTATGRLAPFELLGAMISFSYVPLVQIASVGVVLRLFAPKVPFRRAYALYLVGLGPWLLLFCGIAATCLFAPHVARAIPALIVAMWIAYGWGIVLTCAWMRKALALSWRKTIGAMLLLYTVVHAIVLGYFLAAGQLWPILPW
ncbi:MAG: hypothetical protein JST00_21015 [Deltaproteobacteria bacterium]|nr:hypothetical protein [Deltaproteobacteria bacterium]